LKKSNHKNKLIMKLLLKN